VIEKAQAFAKPFRVTNGAKFRLKDYDPADTMGLKSEDQPRAQALEIFRFGHGRTHVLECVPESL